MTKPFPVYERFHAFQGEGIHMGMSAFFVRTHGCPVHCPWCDSAGTWHKDFKPDEVKRMTAAEIEREARDCRPEFIVLTGGEPSLHDWTPLVEHTRHPLHMETCGAFPLRGAINWVTLSPKKEAPPLIENVRTADEFKLIVEDEDSITRWADVLMEAKPEAPVWLHPEWSRREDVGLLGLICEYVKDGNGRRYRAGWQLHKNFHVDAIDARSQRLVPLGGNPELGY